MNTFLSGSALRSASVSARAPAAQRLQVVAGAIGPGKKWEKRELTANSKPVKVTLHVKKGDLVQIIAGDDKGKVGEVLEIFSKTGMITVKDVNLVTKTVKPQREGEAGKIVKAEGPIYHSKVQHYSKEKQVRSRVGHKVTAEGKKVRVLVKTGELLP